jgi:hypothetical protein
MVQRASGKARRDNYFLSILNISRHKYCSLLCIVGSRDPSYQYNNGIEFICAAHSRENNMN